MKNNRTFLEKLLDGAEVEWKPLKDVAEYIRGVTYNKANESTNNIGYKVLRANNITLSGNTLNFDDIKVIKFDTKVKSSQMLYKNDILISAASGSREHVGKVAFIYQDIDYYFGGFMGVIRCNNNVNSRYLFHIFTSSIFQDYLNEVLNSSTINNLNSKVMDSFRLPIPPLPVQTEIVKILDTLTVLTRELTSELTSELTLRRKQYEYYREKLLSEEELIKLGATTENLGDITSITSGGTPSTKEPAYWVEGNIPWIKSESCKNKLIDEIKHHITEMGLQNSNAKLLSPNTTLMAMVGATIFKTAFLPFEATTNQNIAAIKSKNELSITDKFIFYYLTNMYDFFISKLSGYNMVNLSQIKNIKILLPPLEEQQRIVSILDKFEALTNSITEGLPLAIEQSQKRYEYYRELLLNFS